MSLQGTERARQMEEYPLSGSPAESPVVEPIPSEHDLSEVHFLSGHVARLEQELDLARLQLRDAWARVPFDPTVLLKPYKSDIAATCRVCGKSTKWRTSRHLAECQPECRVATGHGGRASISDDVWALLSTIDQPASEDESLDDD